MFIHMGKNGRPLPPYDGNMKVLVRSSKGWYFLRNRKPTGKAAVLNETFKKNKNSIKVCSPAAARMREKLEPWIGILKYGNTSRILLKALLKSYKENGGARADYKHFLNIDLFKDYTIEKLMGVSYTSKVTKNSVWVSIPINRNTVKRKNNVVNNYYFELILLWGDPMKEGEIKNEKLKIKNEEAGRGITKYSGLRVEDVRSELYPYGKSAKDPCVLEVVLPSKKVPWMCILRVGSTEYKLPAAHMKNYAMHVVAVGS
jgi:hypothetical protein